MPILTNSTYRAPLLLSNGHLQSILSRRLKQSPMVSYRRERISTQDDDFLDLDWASVESPNIAIISHGLEGSSKSRYMTRTAHAFNEAGWDALCWNLRGCSGETNRKPYLYHSGQTEDLERVFSHVLFTRRYQKIALVGFSLGGNLTLKFLGEKGAALNPLVCAAVTVSVPCDLESSAIELSKLKNRIYMRHFLKSIAHKLKMKANLFPLEIDTAPLKNIKNFEEYDSYYTAPLHGFASAQDYWLKCSSIHYIPHIQVPTLIINALDDPFLGQRCYPTEEASSNPSITLECPPHGGHNGFAAFGKKKHWLELRITNFIQEIQLVTDSAEELSANCSINT